MKKYGSTQANASVEGYRPVAVSFEEQLHDARAALQAHGRLDTASLAGVQPELRASGVPQVQLDMEAAQLAQNSVHYQALLKGLNRHYQLLSAAVSDGRK